MSVMHIGIPQLAARAAKQQQQAQWWAQLQVGQSLTLRVLNQLAAGRYTATAAGEHHVVESKVVLHVGETIKARVTAVGDKVELRYLGPEESSDTEESAEELAADASDAAEQAALLVLQELEEKYAVSLTQAERQTVGALSLAAPRPEVMALGGLYLNKLGMPVEGSAMQALYAAQAWQGDRLTTGATVHDVASLVHSIQRGETAALQPLAKLMGDAVDPATAHKSSQAHEEAALAAALIANAQNADSRGADSQQRDESDARAMRELARRLLNTQDLGSVAYHFGSLPVVIDNQLIELDLVLFREHESAARAAGMKKLVMSLRTQTLGRVEIVAQALESRLSVFVRTDSAQGSDALAAHGNEVRELVARLGWNVDCVSYRMAPEPERAAAAIVKHVLTAGTLDTVV